MSRPESAALASAEAQVAAVRDDPAARLALLARTYHGPTGSAPHHLPFRRAALSFMRWQAQRGVLNRLDASPPGSVWWRAVNERLLRDGCEAVALVGDLPGEPSERQARCRGECVRVEHTRQRDVHEEALRRALRFGEAPVLKVSGHDARVVRPVPVAPRRLRDELHPQPYRR